MQKGQWKQDRFRDSYGNIWAHKLLVIQSFGRRIDTMILQFYFCSFHGCLMINMCFSDMCSHSAVVVVSFTSSLVVVFCSRKSFSITYTAHNVLVYQTSSTHSTHSTRERLNEVLRIRININIAAINLRFSHHLHTLTCNQAWNGWNRNGRASQREILIKLTLMLLRKYKQFQQH